MENVLEIIYNLSINNSFLDINALDKLLEILVDEKDLNEYILDIDVQQIRSNHLASYSNYCKKIIIYSNIIKKMVNNIRKNIRTDDVLTKNMYINLSILQVVLHELEHANQEKIINYNTLEAFILRISQIVLPENQIYEYDPAERFAEIRSYSDILRISDCYQKESMLNFFLKTDELQRKIRGYHCFNNKVYSPIVLYFEYGNKKKLLSSFEWYSDDSDVLISNVERLYTIDDCLFYGFPIRDSIYSDIMKELVVNINKNYKNRIRVKNISNF